jgi:tRNA nucleotidyltransferase (CCA-adding enzyme)
MFISQFQQPIHPLAIEVCRTLQTAGYEAFIVGGCVRDLYLNITPKDWDITTNATPEQVMQLFPRTIPTGLKHGTVTVCMAEGVENHFEVTTFRVEGKYLDGRRPEEVRFVQSVEEDLARRDLTINAIAYDPVENLGIDPFGGWQDIQDGVIRAVGHPIERFQEDGLRIMRVARFAARFGYQVESNTFNGMRTSLETLKKVSKERISDELRKTLMSAYPSLGLQWLSECGALTIICPKLMEQATNSLFPLMGNYSGELETRLALMYSFTSPQVAQKELMSLKFSNKEIKRVDFLLETLYPGGCNNYSQFIANFKNQAPDAWEHTLSQFVELTKALGASIQEWLDQHQHEVVWARKELAIDGNDLIAEGVKPGPTLKTLLDSCYQEVLEHPEHNNKEYLLKFIMDIG